jgi:hypothetical protein
MSTCTCHDVLIVKNLNRWFKEKWVDVSRKDKDGKHPPCGRSKAKKGSKGYPKCRPSVKVSSKTPKTSGSMSEGQKRAATKRKRSKKQGVGGKPTIVKEDNLLKETDVPFNEETGFTRSEPMNIAMRLLKNEPADYVDTFRRVDNNIGADGRYMTDEELAEIDARYTKLHDDEDHFEEYYNLLEAIELEQMRRKNQSFDGIGYNEEAGFTRSEPMDLAWRLLKDAVSPEAKRHKLEYDKKYESSPERVKYREELNRERRKRGIYGHGGPDMSHTKDHTLVAESPHANRARHFKERGTLKG